MSVVAFERKAAPPLPAIPVYDIRPDLGPATLAADPVRAGALLDAAADPVPELLLRMADRISRRWLVRSRNPYLPEIDAVAARLGRAGGYFFNVHYEWGCTTGVKPGTRAGHPRLVRVLDWRTPGLGRHVMAARLQSRNGPWVSLTWPGFAGALQAVAPRRFAAAINQAPMTMPVGLLPADWAVNRATVWRNGYLPPAHLLRRVFEEAPSYPVALAMLTDTPVSAPAIFTLAGVAPGEGAIIERREREACLHAGESCTANAWQSTAWPGRARGKLNDERVAMLRGLAGEIGRDLAWLDAPVLNDTTRLAMVADAGAGWVVARGYEGGAPATADLHLDCG